MKVLLTTFFLSFSIFSFSQSWELQEYDFIDIYESDSGLISLLSESWGISKDYGQSWTFSAIEELKEDFNGKSNITCIRFFSTNYGIISFDGFTLLTDDGGNTWYWWPWAFEPWEGPQIYKVSENLHIQPSSVYYRLTIVKDGGFDNEHLWFEEEETGSNYNPLIQVIDESIFFTTDHKLYKAGKNNGNPLNELSSWNEIYSTENTVYSSRFIDETTGFLIVGNEGINSDHSIHKTIDGGLTWNSYRTPIQGIVSSLVLTSPYKWFLVDHRHGWILESSNEGVGWKKNTQIINSIPTKFLATDHAFYIYGDGETYMFNPDASSALSLKENFSGLIYPTVAQDVLNISSKEWNNYLIRNIEGKIVMKDAVQTSSIDIMELKPGMYFIELINNSNQNSFSKFIKK